MQAFDRLVRPKEAAQILGGVTVQTLSRWVALGKLPPPLKVTARTTGWKESTLVAFARQLGVTHER